MLILLVLFENFDLSNQMLIYITSQETGYVSLFTKLEEQRVIWLLYLKDEKYAPHQ